MTGRELIIYILENGLEDEPVFKNGAFIGFMTTQEAAVKLDVGPSTISALVQRNILEAVRVGDLILIPFDAISARKE